MKQIFPIVLLALAIPNIGFSQKVIDKEITYEYKRLPLLPVDKTLKNYISKVELVYEAENQSKQGDYNKRVQDANAKYEADKKEAQANYDKAMEDYKKQTIGQKMANKTLLNEGKPALAAVNKEVIAEPVIRRVVDKDLIAGNLKLHGFTRNEQNAVIVTAMLYGFEATEKPVTSHSNTTVNGKIVSNEVTKYELSYRYPMGLKVEVPGRGVIFNETIPATSEMKTVSNSRSIGTGESRQTALTPIEDKVMAENLKLMSEFMNDRFGYSPTTVNTIFYTVEGKKMNYDEFTQAHDLALMGYRKLAEDQTEATEKLRAASQLWEKALTESNPKDSKARINEEITIAAMLNASEANIHTEDYSKAENHLFKLESLDMSRKQKKKVEELNLLMKDQKKRTAANK